MQKRSRFRQAVRALRKRGDHENPGRPGERRETARSAVSALSARPGRQGGGAEFRLRHGQSGDPPVAPPGRHPADGRGALRRLVELHGSG